MTYRSAYRVRVSPSHERQRTIEEALKNPDERLEFPHYRNDTLPLPVVRLRLDFPVYRLANYRTRDAQLSIEAKREKPANFFSPSRQEDEEVQQAQHDVLVELAKLGKGENVTPIWDELDARPRQTEPLLLTSTGIVVNGNRRLAAMRELSAGDSSRFDRFQNVRCMILPADATPDDVMEVEIRLQMTPETKLPYAWTTRARAIRDVERASKGDKKRVADLFRISTAEVDVEVKKLEFAEMYLADWLKAPDDYTKLGKTEQAFTQIAKRNTAKGRTPIDQEVTRAIGFFLVENRGELEDRAYDYINTVEAQSSAFLPRMAETFGIPTDTPAPLPAGQQLEIDIAPDDVPTANYLPVIDFLKQARRSDDKAAEVVEQIGVICESLREEKSDRRGVALRTARKVTQLLESVDVSAAGPETHADLETQLKRAAEVALDLVDKLQLVRSAEKS